MKKLILKTALLLATMATLPMSANATVVWDWTFTGDVSGSGTLTTNDLEGDAASYPFVQYYTVTDITGIYNGYSITGLDTNYGGNQLLDATPQLNFSGIFFDYDFWGSPLVGNFWYSSKDSSYAADGDFLGTFEATKSSVSPIPEPETYAMMLAGLALVGAAARRRRVRA
jgi:hypothetical protein